MTGVENGDGLRLFAGDDCADDHHDVEMMDVAGRVLTRANNNNQNTWATSQNAAARPRRPPEMLPFGLSERSIADQPAAPDPVAV